MAELERLSVESYQLTARKSLVLILDNIRSGLNVGSIFRSADAFGVKKIFCCGITSIPTHREVLKSALGSTETVLWEHSNDSISLIHQLKGEGYQIIGIEQVQSSISLNDYHWDGITPIALVFGNEVEGISDEVLNLCDTVLEITQVGTKHSINVAVCAGITLYHLAESGETG
jgi:tRNA G18 (ribose-2'-O)-methylase SpoU